MLFHGKIYEVTAQNITSLFVNTTKYEDMGIFVVGNITIELYGNYKIQKNFENIDCLFPAMKSCTIELYESYIWKNFILKLETGHRIDLENDSKIRIFNNNQLIFEKDIKY
jgi:hypothetical protein